MEDFIFPAIKWQERIITRKQKKVVYKFFIKREIEVDVESHTLIELSTTLRKKWLGKWYLIKFYQSAEITPYVIKEHARHQLWQKLIHDVYLFIHLGKITEGLQNDKKENLFPLDKVQIEEKHRLILKYRSVEEPYSKTKNQLP